jgi:hypothetical protein
MEEKERTAIVVISPDMMYGSAKLIQGSRLDRTNRGSMEVAIATPIIKSHPISMDVRNIRANPDDPPDVIFNVEETERGVELTELLPPQRLANDAAIKSIKSRLLDRIEFCHH